MLDSSGRENSLNDAEEETGKETGNKVADDKLTYAEVVAVAVVDKLIGDEGSLEWV